MVQLILLLVSIGFSAPAEQSNHKQIVERAQQLSLQQERAQAQNLLLSAVYKEKDPKNKSVLAATLKKLSEIFYTDKAQKIYEQGNSQVRQKPSEALKSFKEVLAMEPNNTKVLMTMGRTYLLLGECRNSLAVSKQLDELNPFNNDNFLLQIQAQTCLQEFDDIEKDIEVRDIKEPSVMLHLNLALAQTYYFKSQYGEALKYLQRALRINETFPENYYWENQIYEKLNKPSLESAKKYVKLCKTITKSDWVKHEYEPRLCQEYKSLESKVEEQMTEKRDTENE